jgi:hypothetical protein
MVLENRTIILREIEIPEAFIRLRSDGIVYVFYKENTTLDVALQVRTIKLFREITNNKKANYIFHSDEGFHFTKEARENSIKIEDNSPVNASALIVTNLASRIIANFFVKVTKPKIKYRLFGTIEEAAKWLNTIEIEE